MMMEEFERQQVLAALSIKPKDDRVGDFEKSFICDEEYSEKKYFDVDGQVVIWRNQNCDRNFRNHDHDHDDEDFDDFEK